MQPQPKDGKSVVVERRQDALDERRGLEVPPGDLTFAEEAVDAHRGRGGRRHVLLIAVDGELKVLSRLSWIGVDRRSFVEIALLVSNYGGGDVVDRALVAFGQVYWLVEENSKGYFAGRDVWVAL